MIRLTASTCAMLDSITVLALMLPGTANPVTASEENKPPALSYLVECHLQETAKARTHTLTGPNLLVNPSSEGKITSGTETDNFEARITTGGPQPDATHVVNFQITRQGTKTLSPTLHLSTGQTGTIHWTAGSKSYKFTCKVTEKRAQ